MSHHDIKLYNPLLFQIKYFQKKAHLKGSLSENFGGVDAPSSPLLLRACERYQSLFKVEKEKKHQCSRERYKNPPEDEKQKLLSIEKKYYQMTKNA